MALEYKKTSKTCERLQEVRLHTSSRKEFYQHYKEWHQRFVCDHCGMSFKMRYCIKSHLRKKHSPFECKMCNKIFSRYNGLWLHNKVKHPAGELEKAYCVECNKHFDNVYCYKWHLNNSVVHKPRKKNFSRNADLVKHRRRVHEGVQTPRNKICYVCGRGFSSNKILNNHIRTHTGEKPFACAHCPARFAQSVALAGHQRNVHFKASKNSAFAPAALNAEGVVEQTAS
ncbi:Oocyte zinc finger protein XlCOF22 [Eumeta japonica]|uniref:Oocyte zinc finger protein XlCOF22 n=1 Tax=Eumeta variegata TaxID=151549 RepID=A0A4C1Z671_EUMVA|nr:Oocyte zinc finger protein XlCOF22 [Eumeta japonica]